MTTSQTSDFDKRLKSYREKTFRTKPGLRINTIEESVDYVNERGFIFFWPIKGIEFPSLWTAVAGGRQVANDHDDPGHITWGWKDDMLGKKLWYYGRILKRKNTIASLEAFPYFYALSPNYGEYEIDYLSQYQQGLMTAEAKSIYEALLFEGPLDTISLRQAARLASTSSANRFQRALDQLQVEMKILPVGISEAGAWHYAFIYDIVPRHFPDIENEARSISEIDARTYLLTKYLTSLGAVEISQIRSLFRWKEKEILTAMHDVFIKNEVDCQIVTREEKKIISLSSIL